MESAGHSPVFPAQQALTPQLQNHKKVTMTREIKFRAWDVRGKRMIYYGSFEFLQLNYPISVRPDSCEQLIRPLEGFESSDPILEDDALIAWNLMQYTGLNDKNGKEIFEGDVVDLHPELNDKVWHRVVEWDNGCFWFRQIHGHANLPANFMQYDKDSQHAVIGNVFDNPELLPNP